MRILANILKMFGKSENAWVNGFMLIFPELF